MKQTNKQAPLQRPLWAWLGRLRSLPERRSEPLGGLQRPNDAGIPRSSRRPNILGFPSLRAITLYGYMGIRVIGGIYLSFSPGHNARATLNRF